MSDTEYIQKIKKLGKLVAFRTSEFGGRQYWSYNKALYSIASDGLSLNVWCQEAILPSYLHSLWTVLGNRYFTNGARKPTVLTVG